MNKIVSRFAIVPLWIIEQASPRALKVYCALASWANKDGRNCHPSYRQLQSRTSMAKATIANGIAELIELGAIEKISAGSFGEKTANEYRVIRTQLDRDSLGSISELMGSNSEPTLGSKNELTLGSISEPSVQNLNPSSVQYLNHYSTNNKTNKSNRSSADRKAVWDHYLTHHPKAKLDDKRKRQMDKALKDFTVNELCTCIDQLHKSDFHRQGNYLQLRHAIGDTDKIEKWLNETKEPESEYEMRG